MACVICWHWPWPNRCLWRRPRNLSQQLQFMSLSVGAATISSVFCQYGITYLTLNSCTVHIYQRWGATNFKLLPWPLDRQLLGYHPWFLVATTAFWSAVAGGDFMAASLRDFNGGCRAYFLFEYPWNMPTVLLRPWLPAVNIVFFISQCMLFSIRLSKVSGFPVSSRASFYLVQWF